jgi:hypothetical protein
MESHGVPLARLDSLQLFCNLLYKLFPNGSRRHVVSMRREGDYLLPVFLSEGIVGVDIWSP